MTLGVLALQGAFIEHEQKIIELNHKCFEIRQLKDIDRHMDGLIIPGGESTVIGKLLRELDLYEPIKSMIEEGLPVFGTCAGLLLLAKKIENDSRVHFGLMDITAIRNAYGRQLGSFYTESEFGSLGEIPMTFIRAPYINIVGDGVEVLSRVDGKVVAARQKNMLVTAFHPELNDDLTVYKYFINMISDIKNK